jgi:hypothetical protein
METISLNIIAISIFLMTVSTLVLPLFEISSTTPAILFFLMFVVASVDNFIWQSRGSNLIIDTIGQRSSNYRQRIIYHEAGHFLIAYVLGVPITDYALSAIAAWKKGIPGNGGVVFTPPKDKISITEIQKYCTIWMAGIAAEQLMLENSEGGGDDRQKLRRVLTITGANTKEIKQQEQLAILRAKNILKANQEAYQTIVTALESAKPVSECLELLAQIKVSTVGTV